MMTSKIEDRLRKNGVKIKKYYKWLRWSMIKIIVAQILKKCNFLMTTFQIGVRICVGNKKMPFGITSTKQLL